MLLHAIPLLLQLAPGPAMHARVARTSRALQTAPEQRADHLQSHGNTEAAAEHHRPIAIGPLAAGHGERALRELHRPPGSVSTPTTGVTGAAAPTTVATGADDLRLLVRGRRRHRSSSRTSARRTEKYKAADLRRSRSRTPSARPSSQACSTRAPRTSPRAPTRRSWGSRRRRSPTQQKHLAQIAGLRAPPARSRRSRWRRRRRRCANAACSSSPPQNNYEIAQARSSTRRWASPDGHELRRRRRGRSPMDGEDAPTRGSSTRRSRRAPSSQSLEKAARGRRVRPSADEGGPTGRRSRRSAARRTPARRLDDLGPNWNVGVVVTWPIFQGGLTSGARPPGRRRTSRS